MVREIKRNREELKFINILNDLSFSTHGLHRRYKDYKKGIIIHIRDYPQTIDTTDIYKFTTLEKSDVDLLIKKFYGCENHIITNHD